MIPSFFTAFAFLTRLPVPARLMAGGSLGRATGFFPVVGVLLGLTLVGCVYVLGGALPTNVIAVLVVALVAIITGGLHLDGVGDLFDGLGGGRGDRDRALAIMRDPTIGAHGATALILILLLKVTLVGAAVDARDFVSLFMFPVVARWAVVPLIVVFPYVRAEGVGRAFSDEAGPREVIVATGTLAVLAIASGLPALLSGGAALAVSLLLGLWLLARLGGLTGDAYGAAIEIAEVVALLPAAALR